MDATNSGQKTFKRNIPVGTCADFVFIIFYTRQYDHYLESIYIVLWIACDIEVIKNTHDVARLSIVSMQLCKWLEHPLRYVFELMSEYQGVCPPRAFVVVDFTALITYDLVIAEVALSVSSMNFM